MKQDNRAPKGQNNEDTRLSRDMIEVEDLHKDLSQFAGHLLSGITGKATFLLPPLFQFRSSPSMAPRHIAVYRSVMREVYQAVSF